VNAATSAVLTLAGSSASLNVSSMWLNGASVVACGACVITCGPVWSTWKLPLKASLPAPCRSTRAPAAREYWNVPSVFGTASVKRSVRPSTNSTAVALAPLSSARSEACAEPASSASEKLSVICAGGAMKVAPSVRLLALTSGAGPAVSVAPLTWRT